MQTGLNNQESVAQVLRNVSQRRRHGVLDLRFADCRIRVHFAQGKVVEVSRSDVSPIEEATRMLLEGGYLLEIPSDFSTYARLAEAVQTQQKLGRPESQAIVKRAVRHAALNRLYALDLSAPAFTSFDASMVEYEREFAPMLSVGQLLLDVVALPADKPRFLALFSGNVLISRGEKHPPSLSEDEELLFKLLDREHSLQELRRRSMLSDFPIQDSLLRLHEHGCISLREAPRQEGLREELLGSEVLTDLDASIDQVFESEGLSVPTCEVESPEPQVERSVEAPAIAIADESTASPSLGAGLKQKMAIGNARAVHAPWIPALIMVAFLCACALIPLFLWQRVFEAFAG